MRQTVKVDIDLYDVVEAFDQDDILEELGFDPEMCFKFDTDLVEYVEKHADIYDIELEKEFSTMWQEDVYTRLMELIDKDKLTPQQWEEFLQKYE